MRKKIKKISTVWGHTKKGEFKIIAKKALLSTRRDQVPTISEAVIDEKVDTLRAKLRELGYADCALNALKEIANSPRSNEYAAARAAWEVSLWLMRSQSKEATKESLYYLEKVKKYSKFSSDQKRRTAIVEAEAYCILDEPLRAQNVIADAKKYGKSHDLLLAQANTYRDPQQKLAIINEIFKDTPLSGVSIRTENNATTLYDQLDTVSTMDPVKNGPLVSIIVPAYNASSVIGGTLRSLLDQSWRNIEVIVIDDCSTDDTVQVVKKYTAADKRVCLYKNDQNSGAYFSRNHGLRVAKGKYVTICDADDWSHPDKILTHMDVMDNNPESIGSISLAARVTEDLVFWRRNSPGHYLQLNMSSLLLKRQDFIERFGGWDTVRFGADSELIHRIRRTLGEGSVIEYSEAPLSFVRQTKNSLTGNSVFGYNGFTYGARLVYNNCYRLYQQEYHASLEKMYYTPPGTLSDTQESRPFYAPRPMRQDYQKNPEQHFNSIFICDTRRNDRPITRMVTGAMQTNLSEKKLYGVAQSVAYTVNLRQDITGEIRRALLAGVNEYIVYGENATCDELFIDADSIATVGEFMPTIKANTCTLLVYDKKLHDIDLEKVQENAARISGTTVCRWLLITDKTDLSILQQNELLSNKIISIDKIASL